MQTGVEQFVSRFSSGYDTFLGRSYREGEDLSGGQWQKISLARALFSDGQLLILDEPTAALDPQAEMEVFEQFDYLTRGKTAVFISHRMAAARMADRIVVMRDGAICESGTHEQLFALDGEYKRMYTMQAQWYQ
jgi:putative ABC transport system ATP-binding protein/ATP-binding cassette subfamily B protein